jgi:hypothetical protein
MLMRHDRWGFDIRHFQLRVNWYQNSRWRYFQDHGISWLLFGPLELSWHTFTI